jgi:hypothetical protein
MWKHNCKCFTSVLNIIKRYQRNQFFSRGSRRITHQLTLSTKPESGYVLLLITGAAAPCMKPAAAAGLSVSYT